MSESVDDGGLLLPLDFLPEDFFLGKEATHVLEPKDSNDVFFHSNFFDDYEASNLDSPLESWTETEIEDDSYTADLTRQMTHAFLIHDDEEQNIGISTSPVFASTQNNNKNSMATSPQSPFSSTMEWKRFSALPTFHEKDIDNDDNMCINTNSNRAWEDLLLSAASVGQAAKIRREGVLKDEVKLQKRSVAHHLGVRSCNGPTSKPPLTSISHMLNNICYYGNPALTHHQLQASQFYQLRHQQMLKQRQQRHLHQCSLALRRQTGELEGVGANLPALNNKKSVAVGKLSGRPVGFSSSAWSPPLLQPHRHSNQLQQQVLRQGSGTKAVFLSSPALPKQSCGGTGVFFPRRPGSPTTDFRKRSGCSTVLPEKIVQTLILDLDKMGPHHRSPGCFLLDHHETMTARNKPVRLQKQNVGPRKYGNLWQPNQPRWTYY